MGEKDVAEPRLFWESGLGEGVRGWRAGFGRSLVDPAKIASSS